MLNLLNFLPVPIDASDIFSNYNIFLIAVAIFWLIIASIQDFRKREVENWWTFSFIAFVLAFRAFTSVAEMNVLYFIWGLVGLGVGFILMNVFYYGRMFGGGDAKMLMALGGVLPLSINWAVNLELIILFTLIFMFAGAIYGIIYSWIILIFHFKRFRQEFSFFFKKYKRVAYLVEILGLFLFVLSISYDFYMGQLLALLIFISPILLIWAKAVEGSCMVKLVDVAHLTIGDLLISNFKIGKKTIKSQWDGLSEEELKFIRKNCKKKVLIRYGIPFIPAFLIAILILLMGIYL